MTRNHPLGQECPSDLNDRRIAQLEAALQSIAGKDHVTDLDYCDYSAGGQGYPAKPCTCAVGVAKDALSGGTAALDAAVASAVLAERARWIAVLDVCGKPPVSDTEAMLLGAIRSAMGVR